MRILLKRKQDFFSLFFLYILLSLVNKNQTSGWHTLWCVVGNDPTGKHLRWHQLSEPVGEHLLSAEGWLGARMKPTWGGRKRYSCRTHSTAALSHRRGGKLSSAKCLKLLSYFHKHILFPTGSDKRKRKFGDLRWGGRQDNALMRTACLLSESSHTHTHMHTGSHRDWWGSHVQLWTVCEPHFNRGDPKKTKKTGERDSMYCCFLLAVSERSVKGGDHGGISSTWVSTWMILQSTPL